MDLYYYGCLSNSTRRRRRRRRMIHTDDGQTAISARLGRTVFRGLGSRNGRRHIIRRVLAIITTTILGRVRTYAYVRIQRVRVYVCI